MVPNTKQIVFTGAPGAGKTTIWEGLRSSSYHLVAESARTILASEDGQSLREKDELGFANQCFDLDKKNLHQLDCSKQTTVFDRGLGDSLGYYIWHGKPIPAPMRRFSEKYRYSGPIVAFPPWEEIYESDELRVQTYVEAVESYSTVIGAWRAIGYDTIEIPKMAIQDRVNWVGTILN